ncbi:MAG: tetratricopeptide repeat protein, partial [Candidatus Eisenbacteria bacterium]
MYQGQYETARELNGRALALYRELGDRQGVARALVHLGVVASGLKDHAAARQHYEEALALFRALSDRRGIATTLNNLGVIARHQDDYAGALRLYQEALELGRAAEDQDQLTLVLVNLGLVATRLQQLAQARLWLAEGLDVILAMGAKRVGASALEVCAEAATSLGELDRAAALFGAAMALRTALSIPADEWWRRTQEPARARVELTLGIERAETMRRRGAARAFPDVVTETSRWLREDATQDRDESGVLSS